MMRSKEYRLRGRFVAAHTFVLTADALSIPREELTPPPPPTGWLANMGAVAVMILCIFTMCLLGRPGA